MTDTRKKHATQEGMTHSTHTDYSVFLAGLQEGTQNYKVLKHLIDKGSITSLEAFFDYKITRLSGRIYELRDMGLDIISEMASTKSNGVITRYAVYRLKEDN
jgi:hypothetical protein